MVLVNSPARGPGDPCVCTREDMGAQKRGIIGQGTRPGAGRRLKPGCLTYSTNPSFYPRHLSDDSLICFCDHICWVTATLPALRVTCLAGDSFFSRLGRTPSEAGTGAVLSGRSNPVIQGLDFYFWRTLLLGGKHSSHFVPVMPLNCPLDLFQREKKQQRLQFLCCSCFF